MDYKHEVHLVDIKVGLLITHMLCSKSVHRMVILNYKYCSVQLDCGCVRNLQ